jgi:hypothetical protein
MLMTDKKPTSRLKSNLNLKPKGNVARNGNLRIIRHCLAEISTLQQLGYTTQSIRELILNSFKVEISPKAFSSNLYTAKRKIESLPKEVELMASDVLRLTENYKSGNLTEVVERIANKGNIYHAAQRKTKSKIETVSPVASIQAVEARPATQIPRVRITPATEIAKAPIAHTTSLTGAKEMIRRVIPQFNKASLSEGFGVKDKDVLTALFSDPEVFAKYQALETTDPMEWITEIVNVIDQARSKQ